MHQGIRILELNTNFKWDLIYKSTIIRYLRCVTRLKFLWSYGHEYVLTLTNIFPKPLKDIFACFHHPCANSVNLVTNVALNDLRV